VSAGKLATVTDRRYGGEQKQLHGLSWPRE
jgi:hypothetical protein